MLWQWVTTTTITAAGLLAIALAVWFQWTGAYLLIAPLLIGFGITLGAIFAGLSNPYWALGLFSSILIVFVILRYVNPFGLGGVL